MLERRQRAYSCLTSQNRVVTWDHWETVPRGGAAVTARVRTQGRGRSDVVGARGVSCVVGRAYLCLPRDSVTTLNWHETTVKFCVRRRARKGSSSAHIWPWQQPPWGCRPGPRAPGRPQSAGTSLRLRPRSSGARTSRPAAAKLWVLLPKPEPLRLGG